MTEKKLKQLALNVMINFTKNGAPDRDFVSLVQSLNQHDKAIYQAYIDFLTDFVKQLHS